MKKVLLVVLMLTLYQSAFAQTVAVRMETGESVPYVCFINSASTNYLLSDAKGNIDVSSSVLPDSTVLILTSNFFEPKRITFGELRHLKTLIVNPLVVKLPEVIVMPQSEIKKIVKKCENYFVSNYARNYVALAKIFRFDISGDTYQQMYCCLGLWGSFNFTKKAPKYYWDDKNGMGGFHVMDSYVSYSYDPNTNKVSWKTSLINPELKGLISFKINYSNFFNVSLLNSKRAVELFSPLNPSQIDNFQYNINRIEEDANGKIYVISFINKYNTFPKKTKLNGIGVLYIREDGMPVKVVINNVENRFSTYIHSKGEPLLLLTPYTLEINYSQLGNKIYTKSVEQNVSWVKPDNCPDSTRNYFVVEHNTYKKPFENRLKTKTIVEFFDQILLDNNEAKAYHKYFIGSGIEFNYYVDPKDISVEFWEGELGKMPDNKKIHENLGANKKSFYQQTIERNNAYIDDQNSIPLNSFAGNHKPDINEMKTKYLFGRTLYKKLYKRDYSFNR